MLARAVDRVGASSHPLRVRGLKLLSKLEKKEKPEVAPPAGAWIETTV